MVAGQHFTHYLESFGNGLANGKTRGGEKSLFLARPLRSG